MIPQRSSEQLTWGLFSVPQLTSAAFQTNFFSRSLSKIRWASAFWLLILIIDRRVFTSGCWTSAVQEKNKPEHKWYKLIWKLQLFFSVRGLSPQEHHCLAQGHVGRVAAHLPVAATKEPDWKYPDRMKLPCGAACLTAGHFKTLINNYQVCDRWRSHVWRRAAASASDRFENTNRRMCLNQIRVRKSR